MNTYAESDGALTRISTHGHVLDMTTTSQAPGKFYTDSVLCYVSCLGVLISYFVRRAACVHISSSA